MFYSVKAIVLTISIILPGRCQWI